MQNFRSFGMRLFEVVLWVTSFIVMVGFAYMIVGEFLPMFDQQQAKPCLTEAPVTAKTKPC
jgi:uncharacterized membrane protein